MQGEYESLMRENREIESQMTDIGESRSRIGTELSESEQTEKALEAQVESCQAAADGFREKEEDCSAGDGEGPIFAWRA